MLYKSPEGLAECIQIDLLDPRRGGAADVRERMRDAMESDVVLLVLTHYKRGHIESSEAITYA